ncbi:ABC transporter substrate-binding protein [Clostridium estertheticum]|uniref:ABC transporter substrate-binding protein n=1 Tax=Clostridium estertheticum TaxID=238834 RepID=UPI0013EEB2CB|nr:ABC transporter substrate-binding protein [Clostridium estertheticum]MBZ9606342.1 ABC transporter substrate-binding protein [Clostridium estertheticum]
MRKNKVVAVLMSCLLGTSLLVGCGGSNKANSSNNPDGTLVINGDYIVPPAAHGNPFIGGFVNGIEPYMQDNLFVYAPFPSAKFKSHLGESYTFENKVLTVKLKDGLKWSDGSPLTTRDVETTFYMNIGRRQVWEFLENIQIVDDTTMKFNFKTESPLIINMAFDIKINAPTSVYGKWAEKYKEIAMTGRKYHPETLTFWYLEESNKKLQDLNIELEGFKPKVEGTIGSGPFTAKNITTSGALLVQNQNYREELDIKQLRVMRVVTPETAATAMVDGTLDMHSGGIVRDVEEQIKKGLDTYKAQYVSEFSQMSVVFNTQKYPANKKEFRQAMAYLINREEIMPLTEPGSLKSETTLTGLPATLQESWGVKDFAKNELTDYSFDPEKAEKLLTSIGWNRNAAGTWRNEKGEVVTFELACNNGWGSAMLPGEAIATKLKEFGLDVQFRPMEGSAFNDYFTKKEHTVIIEFAPTGNVLYAHPYGSYEAIYRSRPFLMGLETNEEGNIIIESEGEEVNVTDLVKKLFTAKGDEVQEITKKLMKITNEQAYFIPYLEKGFPIRTLKDNVTLGFGNDETIKDVRYSGVGENLLATLIKEKTIILGK